MWAHHECGILTIIFLQSFVSILEKPTLLEQLVFIMYPTLVVAYLLVTVALCAPPAKLAESSVSINLQSANLNPKNTSVVKISDKFFGNREVSVWYTPQGYAVIDGDIIFGNKKDIEAKTVQSFPEKTTTHEERSFSIYTDERAWPNSVVTWRYDSLLTRAYLATGFDPIVPGAIARWQNNAPYLTFNQLPDGNDYRPGVLTITTSACGGCVASIGYNANAPTFMNLQPPSSTCAQCKIDQATHEFGHALGKLQS